MGSSLGHLLADIYMAHLEEEFLLKNALDYSPTFYRRYMDDTFCLFKEKDHIKRFMNFMNGIDAAIQFDMELEHKDKLSFLDTIIKRNVNNLYPDVSNKVKSTDKGLFYNYSSFLPDAYKHNLIYCLVYRVFHIASSYSIFHTNLEVLKKKFLKNGFPLF